MNTYIEVREFDGNVVKRIDVTGKPSSAIDKCENGINRNLNHDKYFTRENQTKEKLGLIG